MLVTQRPLKNYRETVAEIFRLAREHMRDVRQYRDWNVFDYYNLIRSLPYVPDPIGVETVSRPGYTIKTDWTGPRDCDDKTVLILAWANLTGIPGRVVVCGQTERPHHVYPELNLEFTSNWYPMDATYPDRSALGNTLYDEKFRKVFYER